MANARIMVSTWIGGREVARPRRGPLLRALEETRVHLVRLGIPPDRVTVSGIPTHPVFAEPKDVRAMRAKRDLAPDLTTILVSAGGLGAGPVEGRVHPLLAAPAVDEVTGAAELFLARTPRVSALAVR